MRGLSRRLDRLEALLQRRREADEDDRPNTEIISETLRILTEEPNGLELYASAWRKVAKANGIDPDGEGAVTLAMVRRAIEEARPCED